ncbi:MAG: hypothetical protein JXR16_01980 [Bermanella sp.]
MINSSKAELPKEFSHFKERELRWLWRQMLTRGFPLPLEHTVPNSDKASQIAMHLLNNANPEYWVNEFTRDHQNLVISADHFRWVDKKDDRLLIWLEKQIDLLFPISPGYVKAHIPNSTRYQELIFLIDTWNALSASKIMFLNNKQVEWSQIKTPPSITKWINPKNEIQLSWCWDYLLKNYKAIYIQQPTTSHEFYVAVLASLDQMSYEHPDTKRLFIEKMKKTWAQKKYRDSGKAKKQYSLPMDEYVREQLHAISKQNNEKIHETLERLIRDEYHKTRTR